MPFDSFLQFPRAFEFDEELLIMMAEHIYSCLFGTFQGNCLRDRIESGLQTKSRSLWSHIRANAHLLSNPIYLRNPSVLDVVADLRVLRLWNRLFLQAWWDVLVGHSLTADRVSGGSS
jgi:hypothetical protein